MDYISSYYEALLVITFLTNDTFKIVLSILDLLLYLSSAVEQNSDYFMYNIYVSLYEAYTIYTFFAQGIIILLDWCYGSHHLKYVLIYGAAHKKKWDVFKNKTRDQIP